MLFALQSLLLACGALLQPSSAVPQVPVALHKRATTSPTALIPPNKDPFYTAPPHYELASPGEVLRVRVAPGNLTSIIGNSSTAYNILYRTTNSRYKPSWAVTTLFIPMTDTSTSITNGTSVGKALLSYQFPYDSADVDASPSYAFYTDGSTVWNDVILALGVGWYVSVPDYEGPTASLGAGVQSGHATLDSVRAVLSSRFGIASDAKYALWGYSGGSIASEWATELQVEYAPELNFAGAALGGLVPNVTSTYEAVNGELFAFLLAASLLGITNQYPKAYKYVVNHLNPSGQYNQSAFLSVMNMSSAVSADYFANQDIYKYFINGKADIQAPVIQEVFDVEGYMGYHGVPQMPLFIYKAIAEELAPIENTDDLVTKYCAVGANILYHRNTVGGHIAEMYNEDANAFEWLRSVLDGTYSSKYSAEGCTVQNVTVGTDTSPI